MLASADDLAQLQLLSEGVTREDLIRKAEAFIEVWFIGIFFFWQMFKSFLLSWKTPHEM